MEERTSLVIEFVAEACSAFCDTYYRSGCLKCPLNLEDGVCLLADLPDVIKESLDEYLSRYEEGKEEELACIF